MLKDKELTLDELEKIAGGIFDDDHNYVFQCVCMQCDYKGDITTSAKAYENYRNHQDTTGHSNIRIYRYPRQAQ